MIGRWVINSLTPNTKRELFLEEGLFTFNHNSGDENGSKERVGPMMLKLIFDKINPDTCVGVEKFKRWIQSAHIADYEGDVIKLLNGMASDYKNIIQRKSTHSDYLMHLFDALQTVPHKDFADFVKIERRN